MAKIITDKRKANVLDEIKSFLLSYENVLDEIGSFLLSYENNTKTVRGKLTAVKIIRERLKELEDFHYDGLVPEPKVITE